MYKKTVLRQGKLKSNNSYEAEPLERQLERKIQNKEPLSGDSPMIYTERREGVLPSYDIRTDRFEVALDATNKIQKSYQARREERAKAQMDVVKDDAGSEPIQGTN